MVERVLDGWRRADGLVAGAERVLVLVAVMVMVGAIFSQALMRFFFDKTLFGATELATVLMVWVGFVSASLATRARKHIVVDAIPRALGERRATYVLNAITFTLVALLVAYLAVNGWTFYQERVHPRFEGLPVPATSALKIPYKYAYFIMPVALWVIAIRALQTALEDLAIAAGVYPVEKRRVPEGLEQLLRQASGGANPDPAVAAATAFPEPAPGSPAAPADEAGTDLPGDVPGAGGEEEPRS